MTSLSPIGVSVSLIGCADITTARYPAAEDDAGSRQGERGSPSAHHEIKETARVDAQQQGISRVSPPGGRVYRKDPTGV